MTELFTNIRPQVKQFAQFYIDRILESQSTKQTLSLLSHYCELAQDEDEEAFLDFYFHYRIQELSNGKDINFIG